MVEIAGGTTALCGINISGVLEVIADLEESGTVGTVVLEVTGRTENAGVTEVAEGVSEITGGFEVMEENSGVLREAKALWVDCDLSRDCEKSDERLRWCEGEEKEGGRSEERL